MLAMTSEQLLSHLVTTTNRYLNDELSSTCWVAYSGGLDSHVLLHALSFVREQLHAKLQAVHIEHGLQQDAQAWPMHCQQVCDSLNVPLTIIKVNAKAAGGDSPEAAARFARYQAFANLLQPAEILLAAQHKHDQAETLMLQLLRGAGSRGQSAMPEVSELGEGQLIRPLLVASQESLNHYANEQKLQWIEDPSNRDSKFDRNFLRHEIMPAMRKRWPSVDSTLSRVANLQAETEQLLGELASSDLTTIGDANKHLVIAELLKLSAERQRNVLRYWLHTQGMRLPSERKLRQVQTDMLMANEDKNPCVAWDGAELRRYRGHLYAMRPLTAIDPKTTLSWQPEQILTLPGETGCLHGRAIQGQGISAKMMATEVISVMYRQGGEQIQPQGRDHHHSLKKLFQEAGIPTWQRDRTPLLYIAGELAAIPGLCVSDSHAAAEGMAGVVIEWQQPE